MHALTAMSLPQIKDKVGVKVTAKTGTGDSQGVQVGADTGSPRFSL